MTSVSLSVLSFRSMPPLRSTIFGRIRARFLEHLQHVATPRAEALSEPDGFSTPRPFIGDELWGIGEPRP